MNNKYFLTDFTKWSNWDITKCSMVCAAIPIENRHRSSISSPCVYLWLV